jgi:glycosyltransferase involved in cell wall biosynthesis
MPNIQPTMHIVFVTPEHPPMPGGVGAYTVELGKALVALGCRVSVLTSTGLTGSQSEDGIELHATIPYWGWRSLASIRQQAQAMAADWLHIQYQTGAYAMHPAINLAPRCWRLRQMRPPMAIAWTYHDLRVPYLFPKAGARLRRWVTELPLRACDLVVVTNEGDHKALAGRAPNLAKIPIGSNIEGKLCAAEERRQRRKHYAYGDDALVIGYFGFLNRSKGGLTLVQTLDRLVQTGHNAHLLMIGEGVGANDPTNSAYLAEVRTLIHQCNLDDRVQWTGRETDDEVSLDLCSCDVLLMPYVDGASLRRGTLMAGLAHGCAVVTTTPQEPLPELIDGRDLLYVPVGNEGAAAEAVLRIASDQSLAATLRRQARAASAQFAWPEIARSHLCWYQQKKSS